MLTPACHVLQRNTTKVSCIFLNVVVKNKFPLVCRGVDSYVPRFTSSHGQNVVDSRGASPSESATNFDHVMT